MSTYTKYHSQPTPENIAAVREEFWPVLAEFLAAAFAMLVPFIHGGLPRAVLAQITAKLKPAEALARRIFVLQAMEALESAPPPKAEAAPTDTPVEPNSDVDAAPALPRKLKPRDPYIFKLAEPWPNLLPDYGDAFESGWAYNAFGAAYASDRTIISIFKRMKALNAALEDPEKQIGRMRRWLARRADKQGVRKSPLALGKPPGWVRRIKGEPIMRALALTHQFHRMKLYPP